MGLETATYISGLNASNPINATDVVGEGDDHLRLIKSTLLNTFPSITGAVSLTHTQLNNAVIKDENNTLTGVNTLSGGAPYLRWDETDAGVDESLWYAQTQGDAFKLRAINDAETVGSDFLVATRTGTTINTVALQVGSGSNAIVANAGGTTDLYNNGVRVFRTSATGCWVYGSLNNDPSAGGAQDAEINFVNLAGTEIGDINWLSGAALSIRNLVHGGNVNLVGQDNAGATKNLLSGDPDGQCVLYYAGSTAISTTSEGGAVYHTSASTPALYWRSSGATSLAYVQVSGSTFNFSSLSHGFPILLQGEDAGGTMRTLINADPDGPADLYYAGTKFAGSNVDGFNVFSSDSTDTSSRLLRFNHQNGTGRGVIGHNVSSLFIVRNQIHGADLTLEAEQAGGTVVTLFYGDPDGRATLYYNGQTAFRTSDEAGSDVGMGAEVRHNDDSFYPVGMNVIPPASDLDSGNVTLTQANVGKMFTYNTATARTLNLTNAAEIKVGAAWSLIVGPSAGVLTGDGGTGVVIRYWNGASWTDTASAGNITIGEGQHTIWKETDTQYVIMGPNLS